MIVVCAGQQIIVNITDTEGNDSFKQKDMCKFVAYVCCRADCYLIRYSSFFERREP